MVYEILADAFLRNEFKFIFIQGLLTTDGVIEVKTIESELGIFNIKMEFDLW